MFVVTVTVEQTVELTADKANIAMKLTNVYNTAYGSGNIINKVWHLLCGNLEWGYSAILSKL